MAKIDPRKDLKHLYNAPSKAPVLVEVPPMNFLMIDGTGDPNTAQAYRDAVETLYALAYGIKFAVKKAQDADYAVMPLEGLWWTDDMTRFSVNNKGIWQWTAMIMQPDLVTPEVFGAAREQVVKRKDFASLAKARFESFREGPAAQIMHIGPYAAEAPTIEKLHAYIKEQGYSFKGAQQKHHEIYLSDPRRSAPQKMKTLIRQPFVRTG